MSRLVLRPLLSFAVLAALVFALLQGGGRVAFSLLAHLEVAANQLLAGREIEVSGLQGDWRGFNPIVRIERLVLPAGTVDGVFVELDMLKTLLRSRYVLHRMRVDGADLRLHKPADGPWRLAGMPAGEAFDPWAMLTETDQLEFAGRLTFEREALPAQTLALRYFGSNRADGGRHQLYATNDPADCAAPCELRADLQVRDGAWWSSRPQAALVVSGTSFLLAEALLGFDAVQIDALEIDWLDAEAESSGRALLALTQSTTVDEPALAARLSAIARGRDGRHTGRITRFEVSRGETLWSLPAPGFAYHDGLLEVSVPTLALATVSSLLQALAPQQSVLTEWLEALTLAARVDNLRAFYRPATGDLGYGFEFAELAMDAFKGVPEVRRGAGTILGYTRYRAGTAPLDVGHVMQMNLDVADIAVAFPNLFNEGWDLPLARGQFQAWFKREQLGLRGTRMLIRTDDIEAAGGFGLSRLRDEDDRRLALMLRVEAIAVEDVRQFVPYKLPPALHNWLTTTPMTGDISNARLAYQGQLRVDPGELGRRLEISGQVTDGRIRFHPEWPAVEGFAGRLEVAGADVRVAATTATTLDVDLAGSRVHLRGNGALADVTLDARLDAAALLRVVQASPLRQWLAFIEPDWSGSGPVQLAGTLTVPLRRVTPDLGAAGALAGEGLAIDLQAALAGVDLDLPGYRLQFQALSGPLRYRYPESLRSDGIDGLLFDAPLRITADSGSNRMHLRLSGRARADDVGQVLGQSGFALAAGAAAFDAHLDLPAPVVPEPGRPSAPRAPARLAIRSNLEGLALQLPGAYAKTAAAAAPLQVDLLFAPEHRLLDFTYQDVTGWLRIRQRPEQGAIGFGVPPAELAAADRSLLVTGRVGALALAELLPGGGEALALPLTVRLQDFAIDRFSVGKLELLDALVDGEFQTAGFDLRFTSDAATGSARRWTDPARDPDAGAVPIDLILQDLRIPAGSGASTEDPLSVDITASIPAMDVVIRQLTVGDQDYGRWRFDLRRDGADLWFRNLEARLREVDIVSTDGLVWRGATNTSTFVGELRMTNLAEVLPLWGYAANVETESAALWGSFSWPGSPAAFSLMALEGEAGARAETGRFVDVESGSGAQRVFSLLNFTNFAKRISLDFSDVFGRGLGFDRLKASFTLDKGILELVEPLDVEGTGLRLRVTGIINLQDRELDHEMIVTLPVSRGLPWYAAYVALANPLAGLGVLVGERVLRKPLEQFSSARYRVTGTVDNPQVKLVSVFDTTATDRVLEEEVDEIPVPEDLEIGIPNSMEQ